MSRDEVIAGAIVVAFAALVTSHVTLVGHLALRPPRWRAVVALLVAPLAPWCGAARTSRTRTIVWIASAIAYVVLIAIVSR